MFGKERLKAIESQLESLSLRLQEAERKVSDLSKKCEELENRIASYEAVEKEESSKPVEESEAKRFVFEAQEFFKI